MLYEIMREIRNFFAAPDGYHDGSYVISGGVVDLPFLISGEYFLIEGSALNDGVYVYPCADLHDETFTGTITALRPPADFLSLVEEIEAYQGKSGAVSPYQSESFGGYSYTRATNKNGDTAGVARCVSQQVKRMEKDMSLIEAMMDECTIIDKATEQDGEGGYISVWKDGARIQAAIVHNSSMEAQIAEKQGVTSVYTITTMRSVVLDYHTVLRREKDGMIFRVTSESQDIVSPSVSTLDIRNVTAEKWSLPS